jgi:TMEM175 potassium channel family protein
MTGTPGSDRKAPGSATVADPSGAAEPSLGFERMVFFSDAVFAIVITLLVLPLTAEIEPPEGDEGTLSHVLGLWPTVLTFGVSFLVVGQFWIAHHRTFGNVRGSDPGLLWFNLVALMTVAFLPFPAALLGARSTPDDVFPVVFYAVSLTLTSATLTATWSYAVRRGLVDPLLPEEQRNAITLRAAATTAVFAVSVGIAFLGLAAAVVCWLVVLPAMRIAVTRRRPARA